MKFKKRVSKKYEVISLISKESWKAKRGDKSGTHTFKERFYKLFKKDKYKKVIPKLVALFKALNNGKPAVTVVKEWKTPPQLSYIDYDLMILLRKFGYECSDELYKMGIVLKEGKQIPIYDILSSRVKKVRGLDKLKEVYKEKPNENLKKQIEFYEGLIETNIVNQEQEIDLKRLAISKNQSYPKLVFSYHHRAIASQSTEVGWSSCMRLTGGRYRSYVGAGASAGVFICYLVKASDTDPMAINNPTARVLFKPYTGKNTGDIIWRADKVYGTALGNFREYAQILIDQIIQPKQDIYYLTEKTYVDDIPRKIDTLNWENLDDEAVLKIAFDKKHKPDVRAKAVQHIKDQEFIRRIAFDYDDDDKVRVEAVKKLTNIKDLEKIMLLLNDKASATLKLAAIPHIQDEKVLEDVATYEWSRISNDWIRLKNEAIKKIKNPQILDKIVWNKWTHEDNIIAAVERLGELGETKPLQQIASNFPSERVRYAALPFITDEEKLAELALKYTSTRIARSIKDPKILQNILDKEIKSKDANIFFIRDLMEFVQDDKYLSEIALDLDEDDRVRKFAVDNLKNPEQEIIKKLVEDKNGSIREKAIEKLKDQETLKKIALTDQHMNLREDALGKIEPDYDFLKKIVLNEKDDLNFKYYALNIMYKNKLLTEKDQKWFSEFMFATIDKLPTSFNLAILDNIVGSIVRDPDVLYKLMKTSLRETALLFIKEDEILVKIAKDPEIKFELRKEACTQISNPKFLEDLVEDEKVDPILKANILAISKLDNQKLFEKLAKESPEWRIKVGAIKRLKNKKLLEEMAETDEDWDIKEWAKTRIEQLEDEE